MCTFTNTKASCKAFQSAKVLLINSAFSSKNMSSNMLQLYFGVGRVTPSEIQIQSAKFQMPKLWYNDASFKEQVLLSASKWN